MKDHILLTMTISGSDYPPCPVSHTRSFYPSDANKFPIPTTFLPMHFRGHVLVRGRCMEVDGSLVLISEAGGVL